jgi:hypothetical protein
MEILLTALIILIAAISIWTAFGYFSVKNLEEPAYTIIDTKKGYEIRKYESYLVAETTVSGDYDAALNTGFSRIANYIFGNNTSRTKLEGESARGETTSEKIAMTIPVAQTRTGDNERVVYFVLPSKYSIDTIPQPNANNVRVREVSSFTAAVLRFSWYATERRIERKQQELLDALKRDGVQVSGKPTTALYNPPISPPYLLRNEIIIPIK